MVGIAVGWTAEQLFSGSLLYEQGGGNIWTDRTATGYLKIYVGRECKIQLAMLRKLSPLEKRLLMLQNIHQSPKRITHKKAAHAPRLSGQPVFRRETSMLYSC